MMNLKGISTKKEDLDRYEVDHIFHSWSFQPDSAPKRIVSAKGLRFMDEDGREFLDFSSCFVSHNIGHQDPRVVEALCEQAKTLCSFAPTFSTGPRALLAKTLAEITPGDLSRSFLTLGGTEANEAAVKICHQYTGRRKILTRYRSYHGATTASMTLSAGDPRNWAQTLGGTDWVPVPLPYCYRCMFGQKYPECDLRCVKFIDEVIELEGGSEKVGGIIFEPVTGSNGLVVPPDEYFPTLRRICDKWGILMIADEVMSGFGRTGRWFAMDHWDVVPDIMTMAKGISAGYVPLGAAVARQHIGDRFKEQFFSHGATYAGHALACATAIRVIQVYQEDSLIENAEKMGKYLLQRALELKEKHPCIGDVRGLGLFVGLELVKNKKTREPLIPLKAKVLPGTNPKLAVAKKLVELGMIAMAANPSNVIAIAPALIVKQDEIDEGISIMDQALAEADAFVEYAGRRKDK
ncbi:MAG: aminotransferase class III-fold pyridoxal phosphate-dependent enzyme [Deltaproteobacteria bacterium]|nr:aminotransferase class III-fold pyridoxal phosphate-dependent enzyme [Deltaproteobacteria bacterium]MBW2053408.1 aminotransferase class III-fold pyridoxal phosphate-dependent enzyme [Deltaproteobacteria bacterium]MBW2142277.1 aminotransferase class III-fold pyridoxal phosphate-dependent enzyme [Deltaproteobacteria bacterium]MBW2324516.1 aminotransferase class III-fold pyridoxal phosphate-dependent enzyme [Deltaproteobacteria bacterium]